MLKSLFPWKHSKTKQVMAAQPQMDAELIIQEQSLLPCHVCGRTFLPNPLKKHVKVCEKNATKRRKPFDSLKQRVAGTDLADFHQATYLKKREEPLVEKKPKPSKWKEKHLELVTAIRAAKGGSSTVMPLSPSTPKPIRSTTSLISSTSQNERCPSCERHFGPKAFDRHVEWCRERKARIQHQPANVQEAKERLEARIKYRVPPLNKSKRSLVREKYSSPHSPEPMRRSNTSNFSSPALSRGPSIRKPKSLVDVERKTPDTKPEKNKRISPDRSVMSFTSSSTPRSTTPQTESIKSNSSNYDPFEVAQRQFLELLEGDDFKPFTSSNRTLKTPTSPLSVKKPTKRESVIDPPVSFKDSMESVTDNDDFELIENIINEHFGESPKESETGFYLHNVKANKDPLALDNILDRKYSDDIDPRLINENDNLFIPEHFKVEDYSPTSTSTIGTDSTLHNDVEHYNDSKIIEPKAIKKPLMKRSLSLVNRSKRETTLTSSKSFKTTAKKPTNQTVKPKTTNKNSLIQKNNLSSAEKPSSKVPEKKKALPLLKRSMTLIDPAPKPSFKNKHEVNNFFNGNDTSKMSTSLQATTNDNLKAEDLFSVDDEMYEEYKKYEELYLKEKELNANSNKKNKNKPADLTNYGLLANSEEDDQSNSSNNKLSNDSAYGSLRKSSKHRIRAPRLSPLEPKSVENTSSSGSENGLNSPAIQSDNFSKVSKFCHECGTKFPVTTAKFCVECGVKRLVL